MADSKVALANIALAKVGADRISTFDDNSEEARIIKDVYPDIRDEVLAEAPWSFALKRVNLTLSSDTLAFTTDGMSTVYTVPNDYVRIFFSSDPKAALKIEGLRLLSNVSNLGVIYVYRNDNPATYYSMFTTAFATRLAAEIGFNLSESAKKAQALYEEYEKIRLPRAIQSDSQQSSPMQPIADEWELARLGSGYVTPTPGQQTWYPLR